MDIKKIKKTLKKVWWFIWESNSIWSWIVCIILAFIIIKFLVYPGLGLAFGTSYPIVAVVSSSMEHNGPFDQWWDSKAICEDKQCTQEEFYSIYNISREEFLEFKFRNGFNKGDIIFLFGTKPENIRIGDIIVFKTSKPDPIIHRVTNIKEENGEIIFQTKGDHNVKPIEESWLNEYSVPEDTLIGRGIFKIPYLGWIKIGFVKLITGFK